MREIKEKRNLLLILAELVILIIMLPGCFQKRQQVEYSPGEQIVLTPGVYEIWIEAQLSDETAEGQSLTVELQSKEAYYGTLRTNAVTIHPSAQEQKRVVISAWVTNRISDAQVQCDLSGDQVILKKMELYRTARGNRMWLFIAFLCFAVSDGFWIFRQKILEGKITVKQQVVAWTLLAGIGIAYFPYLTDYFTVTEGTQVYLQKMVDGVELSFGNLFLLIPVGLKALGFPVMTAYKLWVLFVVVAEAVIAYGMFYQCVREEYAALFGSMFYLVSPYHLFCIYKRGDIGEALFLAFLPLVICGCDLLADRENREKQYDFRKALACVGIGMPATVSSCMLMAETTESGRMLQLGSGAFILLGMYAVWRVGAKEKSSAHCRFWMMGSVVAILLAVFHVPGRWHAVATMLIALVAAFFFREIFKGGVPFIRLAVGIVALLTVVSAIYHGNRIAFTSEAVYLYDEQNMENLYRNEALREEGGARG